LVSKIRTQAPWSTKCFTMPAPNPDAPLVTRPTLPDNMIVCCLGGVVEKCDRRVTVKRFGQEYFKIR
jgi:hypothetical protein